MKTVRIRREINACAVFTHKGMMWPEGQPKEKALQQRKKSNQKKERYTLRMSVK